MRPLLIASFLLASTQIAASQPTPDDKPAEPTNPAQPTPDPKPDPKEPESEGDAEAETEAVAETTAEPAKEEKPSVTAKYDGGLKFSTDDKSYELKLAFRNQVRFESNRSLADGSQFLNNFYIARARFQAEGHVFGSSNRFKAELGMGDRGSFSFLKDLWLEKRLGPDSPAYVRFGQWKRPFFRSELISDFSSEFNERTIVNDLAGGGRDLGIAIHNDYEKSAEGIEWVVGMFNGFSGGSDRPGITSTCTTDAMGVVKCSNSRPTTFPTDFGPALVARAGWNSAKMKGYSEADLEGGPLRYAIGAAYKVDLGNFAKQGEPSVAENLSHGLALDWNIKAEGFSVSGGVVMMKLKTNDAQYGVAIQPGLMVVPKRMQVAGRFGLVTQGDRNLIEALGAFNYYWHGHALKLATDFGILKLTGEDPMTMESSKPDFRLRVMGQLQI